MDAVQELVIHSCVLGAAARVYLSAERYRARSQTEPVVLGALLGVAYMLTATMVPAGRDTPQSAWQAVFVALAGLIGGLTATVICVGIVGFAGLLHSSSSGHAWGWQLLLALAMGVVGHGLLQRVPKWLRYVVIALLGYGLALLPCSFLVRSTSPLHLTDALATLPLCAALGLCVGYRAFDGLRPPASPPSDRRDHEHERSTQRALAQHALILENAIEGIALLSVDGAVVQMNPAFGTLAGIPHEQLVGKSWLELAPPSERDGLTEAFKVAQTDGRAVVECVLRDGAASFPVELTLVRDPTAPGKMAVLHLLARDLRERRATARFEYLALHDQLTGLPNRRALMDRLEDSVRSSPRRPADVAVLLFDIDSFKHINDTFGHAAGDAVLRHTASRMTCAVRPTDTLARLGGDEFVLIARGIDSLEQAEALAQRFRNEAAHPLCIDGINISIQLSTGIALAGRSPETAAGILEAADRAMYESKARSHELSSTRAHTRERVPIIAKGRTKA